MINNENGIKGQYRHGDVLVELVAGPALKRRSKAPEPMLAEGEVSGHSHRVFGGAVMFRDDGLARSLGEQAYIGTVDVPASGGELKHVNRDGTLTGEHDTHTLTGGRYVAIAQREYTPEGEMRAAD